MKYILLHYKCFEHISLEWTVYESKSNLAKREFIATVFGRHILV